MPILGKRMVKQDHREGFLASMIEEQTSKLPSDLFLWAALASIAGAISFEVAGRKDDAQFVGLWAPVFLLLGLYNKIVKLFGHD